MLKLGLCYRMPNNNNTTISSNLFEHVMCHIVQSYTVFSRDREQFITENRFRRKLQTKTRKKMTEQQHNSFDLFLIAWSSTTHQVQSIESRTV